MTQLTQDQLTFFRINSFLHLKSLFPKSLCEDARSYFLQKESIIIEEYSEQPRGLVTEKFDNNQFIKYFEFPIHFNSSLFGQFLTSGIFNIGSQLLESPVRYFSAEVHSRYSGATKIPIHQDNAYYGLMGGQGLTFYIALDKQLPSSGGLQYISNPVTDEFEHSPCDSSGFSLTIDQPILLNSRKLIQPVYDPGDCTIHHSRSVHFADCVPSGSDRSIVFRISLFSEFETKKPGHDEWYQSIIMMNRAKR